MAAGTSDFLPFAGAAGANVQAQADYASSTALATGFSSGKASSAAVNKAIRQSSIIAAMIAKFAADHSGANSIDDGTVATLEANFSAALLIQASGTFTPQLGGTAKMSANAAASASTITFTDDAVTVATAVSGRTYRIPNFSATLNLAITGIGGMDTGVASANSYVAVYAALNPSLITYDAQGNPVFTAAGCYGVFATIETGIPTTTYSGANTPAGVTATCYVGSYPISTAGRFSAFVLAGRQVTFVPLSVMSGSTSAADAGFVSASISAPYGAKKLLNFTGNLSVPAGSVSGNIVVAARSDATSQIGTSLTAGSPVNTSNGMGNMIVATPKVIYTRIFSGSPGTSIAYGLSYGGYEF